MHDIELLRQYSREGSQEAFTALVKRHIDLVYSTARRQVRSPDVAQEVTQMVFLSLARNAGKIRPDSHLPSWLYVVARRASVDVIRRESRRQKREQAAWGGAALSAPSPDWSHVEPLLDEAISSLNEADRKAILLRFFERKNFNEIGRVLGASEEAAQKRVSRAIDRLRGFLEQRGLAVSVAVLAAEIAPNAVQAAPAGLAASVSAAIDLVRPAVQHGAIFQSTHTVAMTFAQKTAFTAVVAVAVAGGLYQSSVIRTRDRQIAALEKEADRWTDQIHELRAEQAQNAARAALVLSRPSNTAPAEGFLQALQARIDKLKQRLAGNPQLQIPELKYLKDKDWLMVAQRHENLETNAEYNAALADLRTHAEVDFLPLIKQALNNYVQASQGQLPANISELASYLDPPVDAAMLNRYEMLETGAMHSVPNDAWIIGGTAAAGIDDANDATVGFGTNFLGATKMGDLPMSVTNSYVRAKNAFQSANGGQNPATPDQLLPYFQNQGDGLKYVQFATPTKVN